MRYGTESSQFLIIFLPTFSHEQGQLNTRRYNIYKDIYIKLPKALRHLVLLICYVKSQNKKIYVYICDNTASITTHWKKSNYFTRNGQ